jgi:hypothetical protein
VAEAHGLACGKALPETEARGLACGKALPETEARGLAGGKALPEAETRGLAGGKALPETEVCGLAGGKALSEAEARGLACGKALPETEARGLACGKVATGGCCPGNPACLAMWAGKELFPALRNAAGTREGLGEATQIPTEHPFDKYDLSTHYDSRCQENSRKQGRQCFCSPKADFLAEGDRVTLQMWSPPDMWDTSKWVPKPDRTGHTAFSYARIPISYNLGTIRI